MPDAVDQLARDLARQSLSNTQQLKEASDLRTRNQEKWLEDTRATLATVGRAYQQGITDLKASQEKSADALREVVGQAVDDLRAMFTKHVADDERRFTYMHGEIVKAQSDGNRRELGIYKWSLGIAGSIILLLVGTVGALATKMFGL